MIGLIVKGIGGFYYVKDEEGNVTQCRARGSFKNEGITPCVGDQVDYEILDDGDGIVEKIYPRKNHFIRPPVSNIDLMAIVTTASTPKPVPYVIDKFLVMAERSGAEIIICVNKADKAKKKVLAELEEVYGGIYPLHVISAVDGQGIEELKEALKGKKCAFAGPSGVGKSTLINALNPGMDLETGEISKKTNRGKHTTRHVEIFTLPFGAMIYDTPGFTSFDVFENEVTMLQHNFPEMREYLGKCKYDDCIHLKEPECSVLDALEQGKISKSRYESYERMIEEIRKKKNY